MTIQLGENLRIGEGSTIEGKPTGIDDPQGGIEIGNDVWIGSNSVIMLGIETPTIIGDKVKIGSLCNIGHETVIGDLVEILNGSIIAGHVSIGKGAYVGIGVRVRNRVKIGKYSFIGMGSVVVKDVPANMVAYGNPCRVVRLRRHPIKYYVRRARDCF